MPLAQGNLGHAICVRQVYKENMPLVAMSGLDLFCTEIARQLDDAYPHWKAQRLNTASRAGVLASLATLARSDVWYSIGNPKADRWVTLLAQVLRKPHVMHWVGSDIDQLRTNRSLRMHVRSPSITHLTEIDWMKRELDELGIDSAVAPLPIRHVNAAVKPLPELFTVMLYVPRTRADFYGGCNYQRLLTEFRSAPMRVFVVGGGELCAPRGLEVHNLGWLDNLREVYEQSTVLIRNTRADGLSLMVLEALAHGRHVMWSKRFPYCIPVERYDQIARQLERLLALHREGRLHAQYGAAEMIRERYANEGALARIVGAWEGACT